MDKDLLETEELANKMSDIMNLYFTANKALDNIMDWLDIVCNMGNLSSYVHHIAHTTPLVADHYRDFNAINGRRTKYNTIIGVTEDYDNIIEPFNKFLILLNDIQTEIANAMDIAKADDNLDAVEFLLSEIKVLRPYKQQFLTFVDKLTNSINDGMTLQNIDHNWQDYVIMEVDM